MKEVISVVRMITCVNGSAIVTPLAHFANEADALAAKKEADDFMVRVGNCILVEKHPNGKFQPVIPFMALLGELRIQGIGHVLNKGPLHEALILTGAPAGSIIS